MKPSCPEGAEQGQPDLDFHAAHLFVRGIVGGPVEVRVFDLSGKQMSRQPLPDIASNSEIEPVAGGDVLYSASTYLRPRYYARWNSATGKSEEAALKLTSPISFADAQVRRTYAPSKDGTKRMARGLICGHPREKAPGKPGETYRAYFLR